MTLEKVYDIESLSDLNRFLEAGPTDFSVQLLEGKMLNYWAQKFKTDVLELSIFLSLMNALKAAQRSQEPS